MLSCLLLGIIALVIGLSVYIPKSTENYVKHAFETANHAIKSATHGADSIGLAREVMSIYHSLTPEQRELMNTDHEAYRALYSSIDTTIGAGGTWDVLTKTNEAICSNNDAEMFITVWMGILELSTGKLTAANAGHEYPALKQPDGPFKLWKEKHGTVIGGFDDSVYEEYEMMLKPGAKIFVYTDGVPEAMTADREMFGKERLIDALNEQPDAGPEQLLHNVRAAVTRFVGSAEQFDDLTMLCIEYRGKDQT